MTYAFKELATPGDCQSCSHLIEQIRDFLVDDCGWNDMTPTSQDDQHGMMLGWFLQSSGEDGQSDVWMHLHIRDHDGRDFPQTGYLTAGIDDSVATIPISNASKFGASGGRGRIGNELIQWSGTDASNLTGVTRGWGHPSAEAHLINDVVVQIQDLGTTEAYYPNIEVLAHVDLTNPILSSDPYNAWTIGVDSTDQIDGLDGYGTDRLNWHSLLKEAGGKMRFVKSYNTDGSFNYDRSPFLSAPGGVTAEVFSSGFFPAWSARADISTSTTRGTQWGAIPTIATVGTTVNVIRLYGNKDGFACVGYRDSDTSWWFQYFGNPVLVSNPLNALTTAVATAGDRELIVGNVALFRGGGKYRIISQDARDWADNEDRSADTLGGADPGDWSDLDPEETASEEVHVKEIDVGNSKLVLYESLFYSYRSGAIVGEDPRPAMRYNAGHYYPQAFNTSYWYTWLDCFCPVRNFKIKLHASHRQRWRAWHAVTGSYDPIPWNIRNASECEASMRALRTLGEIYPTNVDDRPNRQNALFGVNPVVLGLDSNSYYMYGSFARVKGIIPHIWWLEENEWGAASGDRVKAFVNGQWQWFRVINEFSTYWFLVGPEV